MLLLSSLILLACNYTENKDGQAIRFYEVGQVSYAMVQDKVFKPSCVQCHSKAAGNGGGVNLESYTSVSANLSKINSSVFESHKMPKTGALSEDQLAMLDAWIKAGGPENANPLAGPPPTPAEALAEIRTHFESKVKPLVQRACMECHDSHAKPEGIIGWLPIGRQIEWEHIHKGSAVLDFSGEFPQWSKQEDDPRFFLSQIKKVIENGSMPLSDFRIFHESDGVLLTYAEEQVVIDWVDSSMQLWNLANPQPPTPSQFIISNCYGCHNSANSSGSFAFQKSQISGDEILFPTGSTSSGIPFIDSVNPESSAIYLVLLADPASRKGLKQMPQDGAATDADRALILKWIKQGQTQ